jgi:phosphocarrier protein
MLERRLSVINELGLHARAAAKLVRLARGFSCTITLLNEETGVTSNAKSILSLLYLGAAYRTNIVLTTDGEDEAEAADKVEQLFVEGFGEM